MYFADSVASRHVTLLHYVYTTSVALQVPLLWNRSPEAAAAKLSSVANALGVDVPAAAALYMAVPALASINMPGVVKDRVDLLSDALGVPCAKVGLPKSSPSVRPGCKNFVGQHMVLQHMLACLLTKAAAGRSGYAQAHAVSQQMQ